MALQDPVAVYNASDNMAAHLVRNALVDAGVEAYVIEDLSQMGTFAGGTIPEIHKPQVWVDHSNVERAVPILEKFEQRAAELQGDAEEQNGGSSSIEAICEECGEASSFPANQRGSVQVCPHCTAYMDVVEPEENDDDTGGQADEFVRPS